MTRPQHRAARLILPVQDLHIRRRFPGFVCSRDRKGFAWHGPLQPRESSPVYRVQIRCQHNQIPQVRVLSPVLAPRTPHLYSGGTLCLYWPEQWWWRNTELIAETIVPWTASWLLFYELWLDTGKWLGPSSHAEPVSKVDDRDAA